MAWQGISTEHRLILFLVLPLLVLGAVLLVVVIGWDVRNETRLRQYAANAVLFAGNWIIQSNITLQGGDPRGNGGF